MGRLITLAELATRTGTCESTWRKKVARGEVPVIRIGRSVRVDEEVVKLIVACGVQTRSGSREKHLLIITSQARLSQ